MTRYTAMFDRCARRGEAAFGAFLMLGDPGIEACLDYLDALVAGGADMIEVGIPFSDPVADGPVIQAAAMRALGAGVRTDDCLEMIERFRGRHLDVPVGVLTYANIVAAQGLDGFCEALARAGGDSLLVADVPAIEAAPYAAAARRASLDLVMIAAPNTPESTLQRVASMTSGYTYVVARAGVTGGHRAPDADRGELFERLRQLQSPPPVLGFGISTPAHVAAAVAQGARGVIVGSAIVTRVADGQAPESVAAFVRDLKAATRTPAAATEA